MLPIFVQFFHLNTHQTYMYRCLQLAEMGSGAVAPNPLVGAVLVHNNTIIGEGYHRKFGGPHAEVECFNSVSLEHKELIAQSTLYVSLEPCSHFGKTPPCADLIIKKGVKKVLVGCADPFEKVAGKGIAKLRNAGVDVNFVLQKEAEQTNARFITFHQKARPYIVLKWAQSGNGKIAGGGGKQIKITNALSNRLVHRWRSEEQAILVGTNTALTDNPQLTTRLWPGNNPIRIVIDNELKLPANLRLFDKTVPTIVLNTVLDNQEENLRRIKIPTSEKSISVILKTLHSLSVQSVLVEGGAALLQSFIDEGLWDEARVLTGASLAIENGLSSPELKNEQWLISQTVQNDTIHYFRNPTSFFKPNN